MRWTRSFAPAAKVTLGIAALSVAGFTFAQNQDENKANQNQPNNARTTQKAPADSNKNDNNRNDANNQNNADNDRNQADAQNQPTVLGAKFDAGKNNQGLTVTQIDENGLLGHHGLRQNDRIVSVWGRPFNNPRQMEAFLWSQPGQHIPVVVDRGGQQFTLNVNVPNPTDGGWLGVYMQDEGQGDATEKGARVGQVFPGSPAARAGIQPGDMITRINKIEVSSAADAVMELRTLRPQAQVQLAIQRGKEEINAQVTLASRRNSNYQSFYNAQQQGQPGPNGQPNGNDPQFAGNQPFDNIPPHEMEMESERRNAEQHQRIEEEIRSLREEVKKLRELLEKK